MSQKLRVNIVGIGPGNPDLLTGEARQAIAASNILLSDKRMLSAFADSSKTVYDTSKPRLLLRWQRRQILQRMCWRCWFPAT